LVDHQLAFVQNVGGLVGLQVRAQRLAERPGPHAEDDREVHHEAVDCDGVELVVLLLLELDRAQALLRVRVHDQADDVLVHYFDAADEELEFEHLVEVGVLHHDDADCEGLECDQPLVLHLDDQRAHEEGVD